MSAKHGDDVILEARGVVKSFAIGERRLEILHGVDLDLPRGESCALLGSSGAGKSTLLHVLGLLERPDSGTVRMRGTDVWKLSLVERAKLRNSDIGFVFQFYHLLPELDAVENVLLPSMIRLGRGAYRRERKALRARATGMLESFGMGERLEHRPEQLSGGERQRVALARALFHDPPLLIADEPTGNLDRATGAQVLELLFREQETRGLSLLMVTHDEKVAERCARTVHMEDGAIADGVIAGARTTR
ncbi:MAG: ABC transporter ATP-binding protein [Planctomycetota bacterium]